MIYEIVRETDTSIIFVPHDCHALDAFDMLVAAGLYKNVFVECWDGYENAITILKSGSQYNWM